LFAFAGVFGTGLSVWIGDGSTIGCWLTSSKESGAPPELVVRADCALALAIAATTTAPPMAMRKLNIAHSKNCRDFKPVAARDPTQIFTQNGSSGSKSEGRTRRELILHISDFYSRSEAQLRSQCNWPAVCFPGNVEERDPKSTGRPFDRSPTLRQESVDHPVGRLGCRGNGGNLWEHIGIKLTVPSVASTVRAGAAPISGIHVQPIHAE
jgi:hypothetical protein